MSAINQKLLDLEKRRASGAEVQALPSHVRALPEGETETSLWLVGGGALALLAVAAGAWALLNGLDATRSQAPAGMAAAGVPEITIEKVLAASAAGTADVRPQDADGAVVPPPVSRMSLELSTLPVAVEPPPPPQGARAQPVAQQAPIPAARVLARAAGEPSARTEAPARAPAETARREEPAAAATRAEPAKTAMVAKPAPAQPAAKTEIEKQVKQPTPRELAENEYRRATALLHQGRTAEAQEQFHAALSALPGHHGARQALVGLYVESKRFAEAERLLHEGVRLAPEQTGFATTLARLQVDRGDNAGAIETLRRGLPHAHASADYLAFLGALLQRQGRHEEAVEQFQAALRQKPGTGVWLLGLGMSLQALNRNAEAQETYRRARSTNTLSAELQTFADQRLRQLQ
ncbi:MAG: tetratricopeptide repeat protein [Betaproteobacteria bacterium]|nr:tetratricopeptide repeat protein [Betaproteobacteria bacterium]